MISIVLPVFDEEENIGEVYEALTAQMVRIGEPYEIVFIDDGSRDNSLERIRELAARDSHVKGIRGISAIRWRFPRVWRLRPAMPRSSWTRICSIRPTSSRR